MCMEYQLCVKHWEIQIYKLVLLNESNISENLFLKYVAFPLWLVWFRGWSAGLQTKGSLV